MNEHYRFAFSEDYLITANLRYRQQIPGRYWFFALKWFLGAVLLALGTLCAVFGIFWLLVPFGAFAGALFLAWPGPASRKHAASRTDCFSFKVRSSTTGFLMPPHLRLKLRLRCFVSYGPMCMNFVPSDRSMRARALKGRRAAAELSRHAPELCRLRTPQNSDPIAANS